MQLQLQSPGAPPLAHRLALQWRDIGHGEERRRRLNVAGLPP